MYQVDSENVNFLFLENTDSPTHISLVYLYDQSSLDDSVVRFTHILQHIRNRLNSALCARTYQPPVSPDGNAGESTRKLQSPMREYLDAAFNRIG